MTKYTFNLFKEMLKVDYKMLNNHDEDNLTVLCGKEGKGKSRLGLWAIDHWFELNNIPKTKENFKRAMGVRLTEWTRILKRLGNHKIHGAINNFDEAGDVLSGKHAGNKVVRAVEDTYKVIRGLNSKTLVTSPSLFILSPYIRYHRVRVVWYVKKRGHCDVFFGDNLYNLMTYNEKRDYKDMEAVNPNFSFDYPDYTGVFLRPYLEMKDDKMYQVLENLHGVAVDEAIKQQKTSR
jgi:hypothetical protein